MPNLDPDVVSKTPVLVVGGGLVGLTAALLLATQGVETTLLERRPGTSTHPRARGVNVRTMEILRSLGLEGAVRETPSARALTGNGGMCVVESLAGREISPVRTEYMSDSRDDLTALSPTGWCLCDQDDLEPLLREAAEKAGARLLFGTELVDLRQEDDEVVATIRGSDGGENPSLIRAQYVVAADGARSGVRRRLGIGTSGRGWLSSSISVHAEADLAAAQRGRRFLMAYVAGSSVRGVLVPVDNARRWILHLPYDPQTGDVEALSDPVLCADRFRAAAGIPDLEVRIRDIVPWESAARVADRWHAGRVFLAGDAAHEMPPSGAFGSNTGIQDVHNLAWKLALVLDGTAEATLLDSYQAERAPVAAATVQQAVLRSADRPGAGKARPVAAEGEIVPDLVVQLGYRYDQPGAFDHEVSSAPGTRAAHVPLAGGGSTLDLFGSRVVLLAGADGGGWERAAVTAAGRLNLDLAVHQPAAEAFPAAYGITAGGAVLVRPDGFVAWRAPEAAPGADPAVAVLTRVLQDLLAGRTARPE
jgi:putative polyketide hydroxylase